MTTSAPVAGERRTRPWLNWGAHAVLAGGILSCAHYLVDPIWYRRFRRVEGVVRVHEVLTGQFHRRAVVEGERAPADLDLLLLRLGLEVASVEEGLARVKGAPPAFVSAVARIALARHDPGGGPKPTWSVEQILTAWEGGDAGNAFPILARARSAMAQGNLTAAVADLERALAAPRLDDYSMDLLARRLKYVRAWGMEFHHAHVPQLVQPQQGVRDAWAAGRVVAALATYELWRGREDEALRLASLVDRLGASLHGRGTWSSTRLVGGSLQRVARMRILLPLMGLRGDRDAVELMIRELREGIAFADRIQQARQDRAHEYCYSLEELERIAVIGSDLPVLLETPVGGKLVFRDYSTTTGLLEQPELFFPARGQAPPLEDLLSWLHRPASSPVAPSGIDTDELEYALVRLLVFNHGREALDRMLAICRRDFPGASPIPDAIGSYWDRPTLPGFLGRFLDLPPNTRCDPEIVNLLLLWGPFHRGDATLFPMIARRLEPQPSFSIDDHRFQFPLRLHAWFALREASGRDLPAWGDAWTEWLGETKR